MKGWKGKRSERIKQGEERKRGEEGIKQRKK